MFFLSSPFFRERVFHSSRVQVLQPNLREDIFHVYPLLPDDEEIQSGHDGDTAGGSLSVPLQLCYHITSAGIHSSYSVIKMSLISVCVCTPLH